MKARRAPDRQLAVWLVGIIALGVSVVVATEPSVSAAPLIPFESVFSTQDNGDIVFAANANLTCPASTTCTRARNGTGSTLNNNDFEMVNLDVDNDPTTDNSSTSDLKIAPTSTVLWAGLFWGARTSAGTGGDGVPNPVVARTTMKLKPPGGDYLTITADDVDAPSGQSGNPYNSFADVTDIVQAGGAGRWAGADIAAATGEDRFAGWSLVVVVQDPGMPMRDLTVFRGFDSVSSSNPRSEITVSGFLTPPTGPVNAQFGTITYEGDRGLTGDSLAVNGTNVSGPEHPATNFFNSAITDITGNVTDRNPNFLNNLGYDSAVTDVSALIPNSATSATLALQTTGDQFYPVVVTTRIDIYAPAFPPVTKTVVNLDGHDPAQPGDRLEYTLGYTNVGQDAALDSIIHDPIPDGLEYVPGSLVQTVNVPGGGGMGPITDADDSDRGEVIGGEITIRTGRGASATQGGRLEAGDTVEYKFQATVLAEAAGTTVVNQTSLDYRAQTINKAYTHTGNLVPTPVAESADLSIVKEASPDPVTAGSSITYTLTIENDGPSAAVNVAVHDELPDGLSVQSASGGGFDCEVGGGAIDCTRDRLANGASVVITINATVDPDVAGGTTLTNSATITSDTGDHNPDNNSDSTTSPVVASADLAIEKTANPSPATPGDQLTYTLTVVNNGPSTALAPTVTDVLPPGTTFVSATPSSGTCSGTATVSCTLGEPLAPDDTATVTIVVDVAADATGTIENTAGVDSETPDPNPDNDSSTVTTPLEPSADLVVVKLGPGTATPGTPVTYTIEVINEGPSDAADVTLTDELPADFTATDASTTVGGPCVIAATISCPLGTLSAGSTNTVTVTGTFAPGATGERTNSATVTSPTPDPDPSDNTGTTTTPLTPSADLAVVKTGSGAANAGETITWTVTVTNNGPSTSAGTTLHDDLPVGVVAPITAVPSAGSCDVSGLDVDCVFGDLAPGDVVTIELTAVVDPALPAGTDLTNTATADSGTEDPNPDNNTASFTTNLETRADLVVTKSLNPDPVVAGEDATYTLAVTNLGPSLAETVALDDELPDGLTVQLAVPTQGTCTGAGTSTIHCDLGDIAPPDTVVVNIHVVVAPSRAAGPLLNTATVTAETPEDPTTSNNTTTNVGNVETEADVSAAKDSDPPDATATAGAAFAYVITASNAGPSDAVDTVVVDDLPPGFTAASVPAGCELEGSTVRCTAGTLPPGASAGFRIEGSFAADAPAGTYDNHVQAASSTPDPNPGNNEATHTVDLDTSADISVAKTGPATAAPGETVIYTVTVANAGPSDAAAVTASDDLPGGVTLVSADPSQGTCVAGDPVACDLGTIPAGASATIEVTLQIDPSAADVLTNTATVDSDTDDPTPDDHDSTTTTDLEPSADLAAIKVAGAERATAGSSFTWTITVTNNGPSTATNVVVDDSLPDGATLRSFRTADGECESPCPIGTLAPGDSVILVVEADIDDAVADGAELVNVTSATSDTPDPDPSNNTPETTTPVDTSADVRLSKTAETDTALAGTDFEYRIVVENGGPSVARDVIVTDRLPEGGTVLSAVPSVGVCTTEVRCELGDLDAGAIAVIEVTVRVTPDARPGEAHNDATASSSTDDPDLSNNSQQATVRVTTLADLSVTKVADPDTVVPGDAITWTVTITNNGPSSAFDVQLHDPVPAGVHDVSASASAGTCTVVNDPEHETFQPTVVCQDLGNLAPANSITVTITGTVNRDAAGELVNTATASSETLDPDDNNNRATTRTPVRASADLEITKTIDPDTPIAGDDVTYTLAVTNHGPSAATGVTVTDPLDEAIEDPVADPSQGACELVLDDAAVVCELGELADGDAATITISGTLPSGFTGGIGNTATVAGLEFDPDLGNNTSSVSADTDATADLSIRKELAGKLVAGEQATYELTVSNAGPSAAENVVVSDPLDPALTFVSSDPECEVTESGIVLCALGTLEPGDTVLVSIVVDVSPSASGRVENTATVAAPIRDPHPENNVDAVGAERTGTADLEIAKTVDDTSVDVGDTIVWTISVTNNGPAQAENVVVTDDLPADVDLESVDTGGDGTFDEDSGTWTIGDLAAGATVELKLTAEILSSAEGDDVANTASVTSDTADPDVGDNGDTATTEVDEDDDDDDPPGNLPITGSDLGGIIRTALLLLTLGVTLVTVARVTRRRRLSA